MSQLPTPRVRATCGNGNCPTWAQYGNAEVIVAKKNTLMTIHTSLGRVAAALPVDVAQGAFADFASRRGEDKSAELDASELPIDIHGDGRVYGASNETFIVEGTEITNPSVLGQFNVADDEIALIVSPKALEALGRQLRFTTGVEVPLSL